MNPSNARLRDAKQSLRSETPRANRITRRDLGTLPSPPGLSAKEVKLRAEYLRLYKQNPDDPQVWDAWGEYQTEKGKAK